MYNKTAYNNKQFFKKNFAKQKYQCYLKFFALFQFGCFRSQIKKFD